MPDTKITDELVDRVAAAWVDARESVVEHPTEAHRVAHEFLTMLEAVMDPPHEDQEDEEKRDREAEEARHPEAEYEAPPAEPAASMPAPEPTPEPSTLPATVETAPEPTASV